MKIWRIGANLLGGLAAIGIAVAAPGQDGARRDEIPAELLVPTEEARRFFAEIEERPLTGDALERIPPGLAAFADTYIAGLITPGEFVQNRQDSVIDLAHVAASRPGGLQENMIEAANPFGIQRTYFTDRPIPPLLPPGSRLVASDGPPADVRSTEIDVAHVSPKIIMVMRSAYRREGRLRCLLATRTEFYSDPARQASMADMVGVIATMLLMRRIAASGLCFGAEEREPGVYVWRSFDGEGRRLPMLDDGQPAMRIVPVALGSNR